MRALLVVNPRATATVPRAATVLARALDGECSVEVATTAGRGHARELGRRAVQEGHQLLAVLGGDGTVNEAVNGLLAGGPAGPLPALAVLPFGSANIFVRALGFSRHPVRALEQLLTLLRGGARRRIGLGRADDRWFTCCAGLGLDAEVIQAVERRRAAGQAATPALYLRTATAQTRLAAGRPAVPLQVERPGLPVNGPLALAIVSNTAPWTYLGPRPLQASPEASFETGLDLLGLRRTGVATVARTMAHMLAPALGPPRGRSVLRVHDAPELTLTAAAPVALQVDGEYLGTTRRVAFRACPDALTVIAPPPAKPRPASLASANGS